MKPEQGSAPCRETDIATDVADAHDVADAPFVVKMVLGLPLTVAEFDENKRVRFRQVVRACMLLTEPLKTENRQEVTHC